jgi:hypothetical protein
MQQLRRRGVKNAQAIAGLWRQQRCMPLIPRYIDGRGALRPHVWSRIQMDESTMIGWLLASICRKRVLFARLTLTVTQPRDLHSAWCTLDCRPREEYTDRTLHSPRVFLHLQRRLPPVASARSSFARRRYHRPSLPRRPHHTRPSQVNSTSYTRLCSSPSLSYVLSPPAAPHRNSGPMQRQRPSSAQLSARG